MVALNWNFTRSRVTYVDLQSIAPEQYMKQIHQRLAAAKPPKVIFAIYSTETNVIRYNYLYVGLIGFKTISI